MSHFGRKSRIGWALVDERNDYSLGAETLKKNTPEGVADRLLGGQRILSSDEVKQIPSSREWCLTQDELDVIRRVHQIRQYRMSTHEAVTLAAFIRGKI